MFRMTLSIFKYIYMMSCWPDLTELFYRLQVATIMELRLATYATHLPVYISSPPSLILSKLRWVLLSCPPIWASATQYITTMAQRCRLWWHISVMAPRHDRNWCFLWMARDREEKLKLTSWSWGRQACWKYICII